MPDAVSTTEARANLQDIINRVKYGGERIVIERHGEAIVAIIGLEDLKYLEALEDAVASEQLRLAVAQNDGFTTLDAVVAQRKDE
jgi:prevent-host-death family protein